MSRLFLEISILLSKWNVIREVSNDDTAFFLVRLDRIKSFMDLKIKLTVKCFFFFCRCTFFIQFFFAEKFPRHRDVDVLQALKLRTEILCAIFVRSVGFRRQMPLVNWCKSGLNLFLEFRFKDREYFVFKIKFKGTL